MATQTNPRTRTVVPSASFREVGWLVAPAFAALFALLLLGYLSLIAALIGLAITCAFAAIGAVEQSRERIAVGEWLDAIAYDDEPKPLPFIRNPLAETVGLALSKMRRELHEARTRSRSSERLLDALIEALPDPIIVIDREKEIVQANAAAARTFETATTGTPLARILRDPGLLAAVDSALQSAHGSQLAFSPLSDREKRFAARVEPIELDDRRRGVLIGLREQTEQVMIERMRSDFVANASHEMRTPLASLQGIIETLRGPARDDAAARATFLATMAEETARMNRLVDDLLFLSRIELAALRPPSELCRVEPVVKRAIEAMRPIADREGIVFRHHCASELPQLQADPDQLQQMIINFLDNAFKYGGRGAVVDLEVETLAQAPQTAGPITGRACVMVGIKDDGPGIPPEHIPRLTERFYRVDTARARRLGGTGLGLAIVKHILRRHDGHLDIKSELGVGSTFTVYLPLPAADGQEPKN